jgi:uncharacterized protein
MLEIVCAGEKLQLLPDRAVFWPAAQTLVVADLHFGKPAAFRAAGIPVPELTTLTDLDRLRNLIDATLPRRLVILGDLFHSRAGLQREMMGQVEAWRQRHAKLEIVLVSGNHDRHAGSPPERWNFQVMPGAWASGPFLFSHEPFQNEPAYVVAGHLHPAIVLRDKFGPTIRAPCFCFGERRAILPAFGSFTGMSTIKPAAGDSIFVIGAGEIVKAVGLMTAL